MHFRELLSGHSLPDGTTAQYSDFYYRDDIHDFNHPSNKQFTMKVQQVTNQMSHQSTTISGSAITSTPAFPPSGISFNMANPMTSHEHALPVLVPPQASMYNYGRVFRDGSECNILQSSGQFHNGVFTSPLPTTGGFSQSKGNIYASAGKWPISDSLVRRLLANTPSRSKKAQSLSDQSSYLSKTHLICC